MYFNNKIFDSITNKIILFSINYSSILYAATKVLHTVKILFVIFSGQWEKIHNKKLYAFSPLDLRFRGWYNKIGNDFHSRGRFGYIWDNGLGMAASDLAYNNFLTYTLLRILGTRYYMFLGFSLMLSVTFYLIYISSNIIIALLLILFIATSPLFVACFTRLGKPEFTICGISLMALYLIFNKNYIEAGFIWSFIAIFNLPESLMLIIYAGLPSLVQSFANENFCILLLSMTPGILKISIRLMPMWVNGFMKTVTEEQKNLWAKKTWAPSQNEIFFLIPFTTSLLLVAFMNHNIYACIAIIVGIIAFLANTRIIYYNDFATTATFLWMTGLSFACSSENIIAIIPLVIMLYPPLNYLHYYPLPSQRKLCATNTKTHELITLLQYPCLMPMHYIYPLQIQKFYNTLPRYSRFITEFDGDPRTESKMRRFWSWGDHAREFKTLNLVNSIYLRIQEKQLSDNILSKLKTPGMSGKQIDKTLKKLGISYIAVYSETTLMALVAQKYKIRFVCDLEQENAFCAILNIKPRKIFLLEAPEKRCVVEGATDLSIEGSTLTWTAKKSNTYLIKYRYTPGFFASLNGNPLALTAYKPFAEAATTFMSVRAHEDGVLQVHFKSRFFPKLLDIISKFHSSKNISI